ncbi:ribose-5-phosphate isomerase B [Spiroplasma corruscae]|uniref:Ribose-5-phosphate isomerase B n=1 Tax=Spiroplasma corruscae TaxID=216934 RepID=A0A222EMS3_9MOLU|nr:ribose 5-phosphate isomerase B [Spiroplasma corruscae]ASP27816.1 ribose-5-phosphate isomerase B [Spiroplasma corruscae]
MKIYIGNDHTAVEMKEKICKYLKDNNYDVVDLGTNTSQAVDYPDFGTDVARKVVEDNALGIVICGSGIGISIAANKIKYARAALCHEDKAAEMARKHNNANILALGARVIAIEKAIDIVKTFLTTSFEADRHVKRVKKLDNL